MTHASLFSGIGGAEIAAAWMGWTNLFHCDINEFGNDVLAYWFPKSTSYHDIKTTDFSEWRGRVDVLTGGFPCQAFSLAGLRKGRDDERYLWPYMLKAIKEIQPRYIVGENVYGILSMVEPVCYTDVEEPPTLFGKGRTMRQRRSIYTVERICRDLEEAGYSVQPMVIPAAAVGLPHRRDRVWFLAVADTLHSEHERRKQENETGRKSHYGRTNLPIYSEHTAANDSWRMPVAKGNDPTRWIPRDTPRQGQELARFSPTEPPLFIGDYELSDSVVNSPVYRKWLTESTKAIGNSWVPRVAYEIFRCIKKFDREYGQ